jgi:tRNA pseudouridine38-40 synthase
MKTFKDLEFEFINDGFLVGKKARIHFDNGFGASVVSHTYSYGGKNGLYELAVLNSTGDLVYDNPVADGDVRGYLTEENVSEILISIQELEVTTADFDARFAALSRSYEYLIYQGQRNPLLRDRAHRSYLPLDVPAMNDASQALIGLHDFSAFCKKREGATTIRTLTKFDWTETADGLIKVELEADAFCYSMVRGLIGAVLAIGEGKFDKAWLENYLAGREREAHVFAAPALGLTLVDVKYPDASEYANRIAETLQVRDSDGTS